MSSIVVRPELSNEVISEVNPPPLPQLTQNVRPFFRELLPPATQANQPGYVYKAWVWKRHGALMQDAQNLLDFHRRMQGIDNQWRQLRQDVQNLDINRRRKVSQMVDALKD